MRIGVDCDGVLYHWERTARYMLRRKLRREGRPENYALNNPSTEWNYIKHVVEDEDWRWLWSDGVREGLFRYGHVVGGSLEGLVELEKIGDLVIVTSRPRHAVKDTLAWLSLMTDKVDVQGLHILSDGEKKSGIELDVLIDDGLHNIDDVAMHGMSAVIYDQPWNQTKLEDQYDHVWRAFGWPDVVRIVREEI